MNVEIGTETPIFLFWEYLFRNIGILSLYRVHGLISIRDMGEVREKLAVFSSVDP